LTGATSTKPISAVTPQHEAADQQTSSAGAAHTGHGPRPDQARVEPSLDDAPPIRTASPAYDQLHGISPSYRDGYDDYSRQSGRKTWRIMLMVAIFVIGTAVGVTATWWLNRPAAGTAIGAVEPARRFPVPASTPRASQSMQGVAGRGINPSELPYDGAAPPAASAEPEQAKPLASTRVMSSDKEPSSSADPTLDTEAAGPVASPRTFAEEAVREAISAAANVEPAPAVKPKVVKAPTKADATSTAMTNRRSAKRAKDREIERIRQQAEEELKKKTERGTALEEARRKNRQTVPGRQSAPQAALAMRTPVARCDRASNFILREQCKWRLCNGAWGKNGCPSYSSQSTSY